MITEKFVLLHYGSAFECACFYDVLAFVHSNMGGDSVILSKNERLINKGLTLTTWSLCSLMESLVWYVHFGAEQSSKGHTLFPY